jgi:hypothetical protein
MLDTIYQAIHRASLGIAIAALADLAGLLAGIAMVHAGSSFALRQRDEIVHQAYASSSTTIAYNAGHRAQSACLDVAGNLGATVGGSISGYPMVTAAAVVFYRGWVGGIVSVDGDHRSRFNRPSEAAYYIITILLQSVPYVLAVGAGISIGLAAFGRYFGVNLDYSGPLIWPAILLVPRQAVVDLLWIYAAALPMMALASTFEFFVG